MSNKRKDYALARLAETADPIEAARLVQEQVRNGKAVSRRVRRAARAITRRANAT